MLVRRGLPLALAAIELPDRHPQRQIGGALYEAHRQGVVHRDLKPDNIIVEERETGPHSFVCDFGIAKICDTSTSGEVGLTKTGTIVGTPQYMSPEQIRSAVSIIAGRAFIEVSGGINFNNLDNYMIAGINAISVGALTHSVISLDISLDIEA